MKCSNIILLIAILFSGTFYLLGWTDTHHTIQGKLGQNDIPPSSRGIPGQYFRNAKKLWIHHREWLPEGTPKAVVVLAHQYNTHSGRFENLAKKLVQLNYAVYAHDAQGFGKSEGDPGYIEDWIFYVDDQLDYIDSIKRNHPKLPMFMIGGEMGALTAFLAAERKPQYFKGIVLESIPLFFPEQLRNFKFILEKASEYVPKMPLVPNNRISEMDFVANSIKSDPLSHQFWYRARFITEYMRMSHKIKGVAKHFKIPFLLLEGTEDTFSGASHIKKESLSSDKTLMKYQGSGHLVFEESEKAITDTIQWLEERV